MISAVARALHPGCKADCALILHGPQGALKSTALRTLASDDWFFDGLRDLGNKDAAQGLRGKWIIEFGELSAMRRSDIETVKAYMSRQEEKYRAAYTRVEVTEKRRCVFAGSTNSDKPLRDPTGNRRFWTVSVGAIDIQALKRDRDQLWAEAVAAYRDGQQWWLSGEMEEVAAAVAAEWTEEDTWVAVFGHFLRNARETSARACLEAAGVFHAQQTAALTVRAGNVIRSLGWQRKGQFRSGPDKGLARYVPC